MVWCVFTVSNIPDTARGGTAPSAAAVTTLYLMRVFAGGRSRRGVSSSRPEQHDQQQNEALQREKHRRGRSTHPGNSLNEARAETALKLGAFRRGVDVRQRRTGALGSRQVDELKHAREHGRGRSVALAVASERI